MGNVHCVKSVLVRSYSVRMRENADQNNAEYGHFSRSIAFHLYLLFPVTPYLVLAVQPFVEWTPIKKKNSWSYKFLGLGDVFLSFDAVVIIFRSYMGIFQNVEPPWYDEKHGVENRHVYQKIYFLFILKGNYKLPRCCIRFYRFIYGIKIYKNSEAGTNEIIWTK